MKARRAADRFRRRAPLPAGSSRRRGASSRSVTHQEALEANLPEPCTEVAPAALAAVYVRNIDRAASRLGLRPAPSGGNVVVLEPLADVAFERTWDQDGITYAALPQVAVDLMTSPGRGPTEAEALIEWMEENEDAWRRPGSRSG